MGRIWAITWHTLREAIRMKVVLVMALLIVAVIVLIPQAVSRPGAPTTSIVQSFISWTLMPLGMILSFLAIFLSCQSISDEMYHRQIYMLLTKPLPRWQYILGKWLGVMLVISLLMLIGGLIIYTVALILAMPAYETRIVRLRDALDTGQVLVDLADLRMSGLAEETEFNPPIRVMEPADGQTPLKWDQSKARAVPWKELAPLAERLYVRIYDRPNDYYAMEHEVLTARATGKLQSPDFLAMAEMRLQQLKEQGVFDSTKTDENQARTALITEASQQWRTIGPGEQKSYTFGQLQWVNRSPTNILQLRYKATAFGYAADEVIQSQWFFGDPRVVTFFGPVPRRDVKDRYHVIPFRAHAVAPDGTLMVTVQNLDARRGEGSRHRGAVMNFESDEGMEVLYRIGSFGWNMFRTLLLVWCRVAFLAAAGVFAATFLSFPVACLFTFMTYILAIAKNFVTEALEFGGLGKGVLGPLEYLLKPMFDGLFYIWPDFSTYDALPQLVDGRVVTTVWSLTGVVQLVGLGALMFLLLGCVIFRQRQVAELSV
ncbi:MAG: hypothetical protein HJJLKODD_01799 [Phycisphaerae bacterium]|nr:hypothetical protein [Phycisphaerae bacterium]